MLVMKFGGSSLADAEALARVAAIIEGRRDRQPLVVVSAHRGVTDQLHAVAQAARHGGLEAALPGLEELRIRHEKIAGDVGLDPSVPKDLLDDLETVLHGIGLLHQLTRRSMDYVASFGERLSARALAACLQGRGVPSQAHDAWDLGMVTDRRHGRARPLNSTEDQIGKAVAALPGDEVAVVTGYLGKDERGRITTLGRNGSDYSAAIFGAAARAEEVEIWTDVSGVLTADPRIVPQARTVTELSFEEAAEVAVYGAKVVHPATLEPAIRMGVPIRVLNTFKPEEAGTRIAGVDDSDPGDGGAVKAIAHKPGQTLVHVRSARMLGQSGFLVRLARAFARHGVVVNMIATSEVSVSLTVQPSRGLEAALADLRELGEVDVQPDRTEVCIVGARLRETKGIAGRLFTALAAAGVNVEMISQGASLLNVGLVIADSDVEDALRALHAACCE